MTLLSELNRISIAEIVIYTPALLIAIFLSSRHGFGRNAGWLYLILFSIIRILGSALGLATINDPTNTGLLTGAATLQTIGLSPLILTALGLLGRVLESIRHSRKTLLEPRMLRLIQTVVMVGLILGIVGGVKFGTAVNKAATDAARTGRFVYPPTQTESRVGLGLMIAGYGILAIATVLCGLQVRDAEAGEKRLLGAVAAALPFILVRLIYSAITTYDNSNVNFRQFNSGPNYADYRLGMAVIMEMIAVVIFEAVGLTLRKIPKGERKPANFGNYASMMPLGRYRRGRRERRNKRHGEYQGQETGVGHV